MSHDRADDVDGIRVLSAGAVESLVAALASRVEAENGVRLHISIARSRVVKQRASAGTDADIVITTQAAIDELRAERVVLGDSVATLAQSSIGIAIRSGSAAPDLRSTADFTRLLRNVRSIAYADPDTGSPSGRYFTELLARLGTRLNDRTLTEDQLHAMVRDELAKIVDAQHLVLSRDERMHILREVADDALGLGPLQRLLEDRTITEIMVNGPSTIYVERGGVISRTPFRFNDEEHLRRVIDRIVARVNRALESR